MLTDAIKEQGQLQWITCIVSAVATIFPAEVEFRTWEQCARYQQQALMCARWITQRNLNLLEGASLLDRAGIYLCNGERGKYEQAEPLYERALAIYEQRLGTNHPSTALSLNNLAALYDDQEKYAEAEPLYKRVLAIHEQRLGAEHPDTANSLNNLALLYEYQGKYAEAEPLYQRALVIYEQLLGPEHPNTQTVRHNHTFLLLAMMKDKEEGT